MLADLLKLMTSHYSAMLSVAFSSNYGSIEQVLDQNTFSLNSPREKHRFPAISGWFITSKTVIDNIKNRNFFEFSGSIQYFIGSIQPPKCKKQQHPIRISHPKKSRRKKLSGAWRKPISRRPAKCSILKDSICLRMESVTK